MLSQARPISIGLSRTDGELQTLTSPFLFSFFEALGRSAVVFGVCRSAEEPLAACAVSVILGVYGWGFRVSASFWVLVTFVFVGVWVQAERARKSVRGTAEARRAFWGLRRKPKFWVSQLFGVRVQGIVRVAIAGRLSKFGRGRACGRLSAF